VRLFIIITSLVIFANVSSLSGNNSAAFAGAPFLSYSGKLSPLRSNQTISAGQYTSKINSAKYSPVAIDCELDLTTTSLQGLRVLLHITAPCHTEKHVTITHSNLRFNEVLNHEGVLKITIPVLSNPAKIIVSLADGTVKEISASAYKVR